MRALSSAQAGDQLFSQLAFGVLVDRVVDRLVRDARVRLSGHLPRMYLRDLLGRPQLAQQTRHQRAQRAVRVALGLGACAAAPRLTDLRRTPRGVLAAMRIARWLSDQRAWAGTNFLHNLSECLALLPQRCQRHALFGLHLLESARHLRTLRDGKVLHFRFETAV